VTYWGYDCFTLPVRGYKYSHLVLQVGVGSKADDLLPKYIYCCEIQTSVNRVIIWQALLKKAVAQKMLF
jgi:hypothetical protein